jgi:hypothetical protein
VNGKHPVDIGAVAAYIAGGGLAGVAGLLSVLDPGHSSVYLAAGGVLVAIAGLVRVIANPTPAVGTQAVTQAIPPTPPAGAPGKAGP